VDEFPNYPAGSWGPKAAFELLERDGRRWLETINRDQAGGKMNALGPGDCFGELALLHDAPRSASVRATSYCDLYRLERGDFAQVLKDCPGVSESIGEIARTRYGKTVKIG
jgi:CRP-like cAMP-binding protein